MAELDAAHRNAIPGQQFAFPKQRKEPLENASHVRNAIARFNQVEGVTDAERDAAWKHIEAAAKKFGVAVQEASWREIGAAKKAAPKKTVAKKATAKKATAGKTPAKKAPAKKATARKSAARKA